MPRPVVADLFCGAGGSAMGYWQAGFRVIGFDIEPQPNYPFEFHQLDALTIDAGKLAERVHLIHASPPCQYYSVTSYRHGADRFAALIEPTRNLLQQTGLPYVIENVEGALRALRDPFVLCGSSFGLRVRRHRLFETNVKPAIEAPSCEHAWQDDHPCYLVKVGTERAEGGNRYTGIVPVYGGGHLARGHFHKSVAMGIHWMTSDELNQAIPPAFTNYIGRSIRKAIAL